MGGKLRPDVLQVRLQVEFLVNIHAWNMHRGARMEC